MREYKIKKSSEEIIKLLKNKKTLNQIMILGYSRSTILYYKKKLFQPRKYKKILRKVSNLNRIRESRK